MEGQMTFEFDKRPTIKGYPELRWTGKRPYESTQYYPAQLRERYGEETNGWINKIFWGDNLQVINFRVDRIASKPEILDKDIISMPDDFDIENYTKEVFFMFSGEKVLVDLRCDNSLMKTMVDRFGEDVTTLAYDMTSFRVQTEVSASPTFFGWVFGFNGKVQILAPESVKEQYRQMIAQADEDMQQKENEEQEI